MSHIRHKADADQAAEDLKPFVKQPKDYPWLYFREEEGKDSRAKLEKAWLEVYKAQS
jgi:hypothetical protein